MYGLNSISIFWIILGLAGCQWEGGVLSSFDDFYFEHKGETLLGEAQNLSTKELHLDSGSMVGKAVIIGGTVTSVGEFGTHMVVKDDFGRLLVVTTELERLSSKSKGGVGKRVRILGKVERGKKGLPYLLARSINEVGSRTGG